MSRTKGGSDDPLNYYRTPRAAVDTIADLLTPGIWLDAGCGDGAIMGALIDHGLRCKGIETDSARLLQAGTAHGEVYYGNFLYMDRDSALRYDHIISNPPYNVAPDWIRRANGLVDEGGLSVHLLRLGFLGSASKRLDLVGPDSELAHVVVLRNRPSFCLSTSCRICGGRWRFPTETAAKDALHPEGCVHSGFRPMAKSPYTSSRTDSTDYAWFVWQRGWHGAATLEVR
jgi:hypothetical protein|tara:strand:- start:6521 stop:7207 length:687 start_codon:yes stop_codon:yes gene_type:complete